MKRILLSLFITTVSTAAPILFRQSGFHAASNGLPAGWHPWAARPEIAPRTFVDPVHSRGEPGSLAISGAGNVAAYGGWECILSGVEAGKWYRFVGYYRAEGVHNASLQVVAKLDWVTAQGKRAAEPDFAYRVTPEGAWNRITLEAPAPGNAAAVKVQLFLANAAHATVWWDDVALDAIAPPAPRPVRVAAVNLRPEDTGSAAESVRRFLAAVDRLVNGRIDVILLPETITVVGTGKSAADVAETLPGPTTERLGNMARRKNAYLVTSIYEREGAAIYNTAVLLDRSGRIAGRYHKVYLPWDEVDDGVTPGNDYPVFRTDFGTIGMMICYDVFYADPARALALRGAELILMPIWGGDETLGKARAIENRVFIAASGYDYPTYVMDPAGEILARAREPGTAAVAEIDLNRRYAFKFLGQMRERLMREVRFDVRIK